MNIETSKACCRKPVQPINNAVLSEVCANVSHSFSDNVLCKYYPDVWKC